jgi:outer membrane protein assembly factor BamA
MFGVGYSDSDGILINASMNFKNFLGTGKEVALTGNNSSVNRNLNLSYIDPYYTADGISRSFNLYSTRTDAEAANTASYTSDTDGVGVSYGIDQRGSFTSFDWPTNALHCTQTLRQLSAARLLLLKWRNEQFIQATLERAYWITVSTAEQHRVWWAALDQT